MLKASALLRHLHARNLARARDQNPLTRLPGNLEVDRHLCDMLAGKAEHPHLVYFDFNHFKAFNDLYGFRQGDRAIQLFADMLREKAREKGYFVGHVGGDDFVLSTLDQPTPEILSDTRLLLERFAADAAPLHSPEHRSTGFIRCEDRQGNPLDLPLLSVSACLLSLTPSGHLKPDTVVAWAAQGKKRAKESPDHLCMLQVNGRGEAEPFPANQNPCFMETGRATASPAHRLDPGEESGMSHWPPICELEAAAQAENPATCLPPPP